MCPVSVGSSRVTRALESGAAKLWVVLVGVNQYHDRQFPPLSYPALDCQGLGDAIATATQLFPRCSLVMHHDFALSGEKPREGVNAREVDALPRSLPASLASAGQVPLTTHAALRGLPARSPHRADVWDSVRQVVAEAAPQDTVLFYFSGHGLLTETGQAVLCLADTRKDDLLQTGLGVQNLLAHLSQSRAHQQIVWLDACHSGGMTFRTGKGEGESLPNPTPHLVELLRQRAAQSKGFYALLSCDQDQQSWEFPELGHGVFTYFLMRGLLGEAADDRGVIEADALYKYVYYQTLQYIDQTNQQVRLMNQQKRGRGEAQLQSEYPLQTPKRIVEGIGELVLGLKPGLPPLKHPRRAVLVDGWGGRSLGLNLGRVLRSRGSFALNYFPQGGKNWDGVKDAIRACLQTALPRAGAPYLLPQSATALLYLRGRMEVTESGEAVLVLKDSIRLSRSWLRQELRRSRLSQHILILDCPQASDLAEWVEDLQTDGDRGQCLIAAAAVKDNPDAFAQALLHTLMETDGQTGLSAAGWIAHLQAVLAEISLPLHVWLSGRQGVIEILPGTSATGDRPPQDDFDLGLCPYLGLRAFGEDDAPFFFGRDSLTVRLLQSLSRQSVVAVVGASGSGKSSVVHAGVLPQLRQGQQLPGSDRWWIRSLRPGDRPMDALVKHLLDSGTEKERQYQQAQLEGMLYQGTEGFVHWLRSRPEPMVVLVVDQFEEVFTLAEVGERQRFLEMLLGAVQYAGDRFKLMLTLRTDFVAACLEVPALADLIQRSSVLVSPHLTDADYRQIIVRPAERVGLTVEPELIEVLLQDLNRGAGDLPLLEFVLEQIWEHRHPGLLTLSVYQQSIGGLKGALERKAQSVYEALDGDAQACARWIFLSLTQLGEGTEDTRRRVPKADLVVNRYPVDLVDRTLQALTGAKLVVVNTGAGEPAESKGEPAPGRSLSVEEELQRLKETVTVEVAHEILIRHWSTLRWWLEENRARLRSQRYIEQAAQQWQQSDRQPDFLLRGVRLGAAEELYVKYTDELSREVQEFIEAGLQERDRDQRQVRQRLRRARTAIALIGGLTLLTTALGALAYRQQRYAQRNELAALNALSESQMLSHQQIEALLTGLQAGRLLQRQGWGVPHPLRMQTVSTLQQAVEKTQESDRLVGHSQRVTAVDLTPEGRVISGSDDGTIRSWDERGTVQQVLNNRSRVTRLALSPDGDWIAAAGADGVRLWHRETGTAQRQLAAREWVTDVAWQPDGGAIATSGRTSVITLWNPTTGQQLRTLSGHRGWVNGVAFSTTGQLLASAGDDGTVRLWNALTGAPARIWTGHEGRVTSVDWNSQGQVASAGDDGTVRLWSLTTGTAQVLQGHTGPVSRVRFSADGKWLVSAGSDGTLRRWRSTDGVEVDTLRGHGSAVLDAQFGRDRPSLISAGADKTIRIWQVGDRSHAAIAPFALALSPKGQTLAVAGWDGTIHLFPAILTQAPQSLSGHAAPVNALAYSPDGNQLASASDDGTIRLWNGDRRILVRTLKGHEGKVTAVAFSRDGTRLASASEDQTIRLWETATGAAIATLPGHRDGVSQVLFTHAGTLISGSYDATIRVWRLDGTVVRTLEGHSLAIAALALSPDGETLASGSWDNTIRLWRVRDGAPLHTLTGHQDGVTTLAFSPDGRTLISGSADRTLKLWNAHDGALIKTLLGLPDLVRQAVFRDNASQLITVSPTSGVQTWTLDLEILLQRGCDRLRTYLGRHSEGDRKLCPNAQATLGQFP